MVGRGSGQEIARQHRGPFTWAAVKREIASTPPPHWPVEHLFEEPGVFGGGGGEVSRGNDVGGPSTFWQK